MAEQKALPCVLLLLLPMQGVSEKAQRQMEHVAVSGPQLIVLKRHLLEAEKGMRALRRELDGLWEGITRLDQLEPAVLKRYGLEKKDG